MTKPHDITATQIIDHLEARFPAPEWATFVELRDNAGFSARRSCDFFAMNTWPSKGLLRIAVEVKVSRADFHRELDDPSKRKPFEDVSHEFYFAAPRNLVAVEELPKGCGLLEATAKTLRCTRRATQREPRDVPGGMLAMILRAAAKRAEDLRKRYQEFAEFAGRTISVDDLRRISEKFQGSQLASIRHRAKQEALAERRASSKESIDAWLPLLKELRRTIRTALGKPFREPVTTEEAAAWLRSLPAHRLGGIASSMRRIADEILGEAS